MTDWLIAALLRVYPSTFRQRFGTGLRFTLEQELAGARRKGRMAVVRFWIRTTWSLLVEGVRERFAAGAGRLPHGSDGTIDGTRDTGGGEIMTRTLQDFTLALRRLVKRPGFAFAGIVTLGLGLGAATAIFSVLNTVVLRPLPYEASDRLVWISHRSDQSTLGVPSGAYLEYKSRSRTVEDMAIYTESTTTLQIDGEPRELGLIRTTPNLFDVLGVPAGRGRTFTPDDIVDGADPVAVVSHAFWLRAHGADPDIIGKPVVEGGRSIVIGVMPPEFDFVRPAATVVFGNAFKTPDLFLPTRIDESQARVGNFMFQGIGRLTGEATTDQSLGELYRLMREAADRYVGTTGGHSRESLDAGSYTPTVDLLKDAVVGDIGGVLWIVMGTVTLVLLIAAANVTNLFVLRAESLQKELAVRTALGASRGSLARWFMAEGLTMSLLGGVLGVAIASFGSRAVLGLAPADLPRIDDLALDPAVLGFALVLSVASGLLFGLVPVLRYRVERTVGLSLTGTRTVGESRSRRRGREVLVVGQVAFALVLLVGAGLLLRTFVSLRSVDPGFGAGDVTTFKLALDGSQFDGELSRAQFMVQVTDRVGRLPGVTMAAFSADLPVDGNERVDAIVTDEDLDADLGVAARTLRVFAGAGYVTAIGAKILRGRDLEPLDFADYPRVALVNESFADARWPGEEAIGRRIAQRKDPLTLDEDVWYTVVGVVADVRERSLMREPEPIVYLPTVFLPGSDYAMFVTNQTLLVKATAAPDDIIPAVREEIRALDPAVLVDDVRSLDRVVAGSVQQVTFAMVLILLSSGVALALGVVGIYGAVAYTVGRRTREFGVRMALGARAADVRNSVLRQGGAIGAIGIAIGLVGAGLLARVLRSLLFGVSTLDVPTYGAVAAGLMALVLLAGLAPALRATRVDPVRAISAD